MVDVSEVIWDVLSVMCVIYTLADVLVWMVKAAARVRRD